MSDRYSYKTQFEPPIFSGKIVLYNPERKTGKVTLDGVELALVNVDENLNVGDIVTFTKNPIVQNPNQWYARFISKGFISKDGCVITDQLNSHVHGDLTKRLSSITKRISCNERNYFYEKLCYPTIIGKSSCVPITWEDEIVYAKRKGRMVYSKFVKNRMLIPTDCISIFLMKKQDIYLIKTCYYGEYTPIDEFDNSDNSSEERFSFWNNHALVFGSEPIDVRTITSTCPWSGVNENNRFGNLIKNCNQNNFTKIYRKSA